MASAKIIVATLVVALACLNTLNATPVPDSAGMVDMVNGLAYGGIPYGSVSGMLANYGQRQPQYAYNDVQQAAASVLVPNTRTSRLVVPPQIINPIGYY